MYNKKIKDKKTTKFKEFFSNFSIEKLSISIAIILSISGILIHLSFFLPNRDIDGVSRINAVVEKYEDKIIEKANVIEDNDKFEFMYDDTDFTIKSKDGTVKVKAIKNISYLRDTEVEYIYYNNKLVLSNSNECVADSIVFVVIIVYFQTVFIWVVISFVFYILCKRGIL